MPRSQRLDQITKTEGKNTKGKTGEGKNDEDEHSSSLTALRLARPRVRDHGGGAGLPTPALGPVRRHAVRSDHPLRPEGRDRARRDRRRDEYADVAAQGRGGARAPQPP